MTVWGWGAIALLDGLQDNPPSGIDEAHHFGEMFLKVGFTDVLGAQSHQEDAIAVAVDGLADKFPFKFPFQGFHEVEEILLGDRL